MLQEVEVFFWITHFLEEDGLFRGVFNDGFWEVESRSVVELAKQG